MKRRQRPTTFRRWAKRYVPSWDGRFYFTALEQPVTIQRDQWGIAHIHAHNRHDLFFAQGFVHAQDRLWQMELNRRAAQGTLSAVFGRFTLDTDRLSRSLGFAHLARQDWLGLPTAMQSDVEAYSQGVNAYLTSGQPLPLEFQLIRHEPEPWQPLDTLAYARLQMWALTEGASAELVTAQLQQQLSADQLRNLLPYYPKENPLTLPAGLEVNELLETAVTPFLGKGNLSATGRGSNGWVIAASRSATGHALLCNDMHLPLATPSIWHFQHLSSDDGWHVTGFTQPAMPYVFVGHNDHIAWGATLSFVDGEDFFVEKLHPEDDTLYEFRNEWRQADIRHESILVRGQATHVERVRQTHHGPIVAHFQPAKADQQALALSSIALQPNVLFDGFGLLNQAQNWEDFVTTVSHIQTPWHNLLYADVRDNIGHWVTGRIPLRAEGDGLTPAPGWAGTHEWTGHIPVAEMPHALNPAQGYIVSANHRIVGDDYPHYLGQVWRNGYRARRLTQLINEKDKISVDDCERWHMDLYSIPGHLLAQQLAHLASDDPEVAVSLHALQNWDGYLETTTIGGTIYEVFLTKLAGKILASQLSPALRHRYLGLGAHPQMNPVNEFHGYWATTLLRWLTGEENEWLPSGEERDELLLNCLAETTAVLRQTLGEDPEQWHWGRLHRVRFPHALGMIRPFNPLFSPGPYPIGGDGDTVCQTSIRPDLPFDNNAISVSSRLIVDLGDLHNTQAILAPGQSGHVGSPYYVNLIALWRQGSYFSGVWGNDGQTADPRHQLNLKPPN